MLKQRDDNGTLRPIAYFSKKHLQAECNYDIYDLELLAIVKAFQEWEPELICAAPNKPIQVITDHKNLQTFMTTKELTRRQARWSLFLSQFNFQISYLKGANNFEADLLSRRPQDIPKDTLDPRVSHNIQVLLKPKNVHPDLAPAIDAAIRELSLSCDNSPLDHIPHSRRDEVRICFSRFEDADWSEDTGNVATDEDFSQDSRPTEQVLDEAYAQDQAAQELFKLLDTGAQRLPRAFRKMNFRTSLADIHATGSGASRRIWIDKTRLYVPKDSRCRRRIFDLAHDHQISGHKGPKNTFFHMVERYFWPGMHQNCQI